jgi:hypothetical protein
VAEGQRTATPSSLSGYLHGCARASSSRGKTKTGGAARGIADIQIPSSALKLVQARVADFEKDTSATRCRTTRRRKLVADFRPKRRDVLLCLDVRNRILTIGVNPFEAERVEQ